MQCLDLPVFVHLCVSVVVVVTVVFLQVWVVHDVYVHTHPLHGFAVELGR